MERLQSQECDGVSEMSVERKSTKLQTIFHLHLHSHTHTLLVKWFFFYLKSDVTVGRAIVWRMWRCQRHVSETKIDEVTGHSAEICFIIMFKKLLEA